MRVTAVAPLALSALASAASILPLSNGFPKLGSKELATVEKHAGGPLPNTPLPKKLSTTAEVTFKLVQAQETFEVFYFTNMLHNIKMKKPGWTFPTDAEMEEAYAAFFRIRAQEQLHAAAAAAALETAGATPDPLCDFIFPVDNFKDAVALAGTFTDVVLGVLPTVQSLAAEDGGDELGLIPVLGSILGQEAEQVGYFRLLGKKKPSAAPFLTGAAGEFAYSALKEFIVPGSCPSVENLPVASFAPITVLNPPILAVDKLLKMQVVGAIDMSTEYVTYINGASIPISVPIKSAVMKGKTTTFEAELPFASKGMAKGLTIASVTKGDKGFETPADVAAAAVYGPGLIEIR